MRNFIFFENDAERLKLIMHIDDFMQMRRNSTPNAPVLRLVYIKRSIYYNVTLNEVLYGYNDSTVLEAPYLLGNNLTVIKMLCNYSREMIYITHGTTRIGRCNLLRD